MMFSRCNCNTSAFWKYNSRRKGIGRSGKKTSEGRVEKKGVRELFATLTGTSLIHQKGALALHESLT